MQPRRCVSTSIEINKPITISPEDRFILESHTCAEMLVELIGASVDHIEPYFPVIFIYALVYFDDPSRGVRRTMRRLLKRLICAYTETTPADLHAVDCKHDRDSKDDCDCGLARFARGSLTVVWPDSPEVKDEGHDAALISSGAFVSLVVDVLRGLRPEAVFRIGYESLHWACLSTSIPICKKAHSLYRAILEPINEPCLYVLLKSLVGVVVDWSSCNSDDGESNEKYMSEVLFILETLLSVTKQLHRTNRLQHYPSLFWTAVALLRSPEDEIYGFGLKLLRHLEGFPFLFGRGAVVGEDGIIISHVPVDFYIFSERWVPPFAGIQPMLLHGLMNEDNHRDALKALQLVSKLNDPELVDPSPQRDLVTLVSVLPYLDESMRSRKSHRHHQVDSLPNEVVNCLRKYFSADPRVGRVLDMYQELSRDKLLLRHDPDLFINSIAVLIVEKWGLLTQTVSEYLNAMITDTSKSRYTQSVLKLTNSLLQQPGASNFIKGGFQEILLKAHEIVTRGTSLMECTSVDSTAQLAAAQSFNEASAAADLISTLVALSPIDSTTHEAEEKESKLSASEGCAELSRQISDLAGSMVITLPERTHSQLNDALRKVLKHTPLVTP